MSVLVDCVLTCLAASQLIDLWFNGTIPLIATRRAYVEASRLNNDSFSVQLFSCSYCLAHWAVLLTATLYWVFTPFAWLVHVLACIRVVTLTDMLLPRSVRFQRATDSAAKAPDHRI